MNVAYQGSSVSLSSDGNTAIVGGQFDNTDTGAVWIFTRSGGDWTQQGNKLVGTGSVDGACQGCSVSLSSDGNTAIVGGYDDNSGAGAAWVFTRSDAVWSQEGGKLVGNPASVFGNAVSLSGDGNTAIIGEPDLEVYISGSYLPRGAAWVFTRSEEVWTGGSLLAGTDAVEGGGYGTGSRQGSSVALSSDGNTAIVGGYGDSSNVGAAWIFATPSAPLPVELVSFTATSNLFNAELSWKTATEINNAGFDVQRQLMSSNWTKIGSVAGAGTSNVPHNYSFTDKVETAGTYSYRLKQIDHNGAFTYSQEVQVAIAAPKVFSLGQNYPNPFNPTTDIQFTVPTNGRATLKVYNTLGQEVAALFDGVAVAGQYNQVTFNASNLASGIYFSRLEFGGKMQMNKMLLLK